MNETAAHGDKFGRRKFLANASALSAASLLGLPHLASADPAPEISRIRLIHAPTLCLAPQYLAEQLLYLEGFSKVEYYESPGGVGPDAIANGQADFSSWETLGAIPVMEATNNLLAIAGVHAGCVEVLGGHRVKSIRDIGGKTIAVSMRGGSDHVFLASIMGYVGMDPRNDVIWIEAGSVLKAMQLFEEAKSDVFVGFPPQPQDLVAKNVGHVILT